MAHTILLVQWNRSPQSRTYFDFESISAAMDGVCQLYEQRLKQLNPGVARITYDVTDLYRYIDEVFDMTALVLSRASGAYEPRTKDWIKQQAFEHLRRVAGR